MNLTGCWAVRPLVTAIGMASLTVALFLLGGAAGAVPSQQSGAENPLRWQKGSAALFQPDGRVGAAAGLPGPGPNHLAPTPPMGWMSWEVFRCETNCTKSPKGCINEDLYKETTEQLVAGGYLKAGYNQVSIDDCWENKARDQGQKLMADPDRFPSGMKALGDFMHAKGVKFGIYSDEGTKTCGGYPGSKDYEGSDATTFASWGVDYLKLDGCYNTPTGYADGYPTMGGALQASHRNITYSCSWPAYLGNDESKKPFDAMIQAGCNLWRNWDDIQCSWKSLSSIIDHWGDWGHALAPHAGPGHWHDMDMLLIGAGCLTLDEEKTQMAIWAISASPLIMGNDLRQVRAESREILLNKDAIAVSQDPLGRMGMRLPASSPSGTEVWARPLAFGHAAVALFNKAASGAVDITVDFADVGFPAGATLSVLDIWTGQVLGSFQETYTAKAVPTHGTAFLRLQEGPSGAVGEVPVHV